MTMDDVLSTATLSRKQINPVNFSTSLRQVQLPFSPLINTFIFTNVFTYNNVQMLDDWEAFQTSSDCYYTG